MPTIQIWVPNERLRSEIKEVEGEVKAALDEHGCKLWQWYRAQLHNERRRLWRKSKRAALSHKEG